MQEDLLKIERDLKAAKISIDDFCTVAGIHRATWQRWKAEQTYPMLKTWERAKRAAGMLLNT